MDNKVNLYVFAKKEVVLIFIFMFLVAATSFIFGIKVGKEHVYRESGIINQDKRKVEMLSAEKADGVEENIRKKMEEDVNAVHVQLEEEIKKQMVEMKETEPPPSPAELLNGRPDVPSISSPSVKKYTIQLGSYRSQKDAEAFARGFIVRGYEAMIREVDIPSKGTWFRVSLGTFDTAKEAEEYIKQEESLFQGEDYIIRILL